MIGAVIGAMCHSALAAAAQSPDIGLRDVTDQSGIHFTTTSGQSPSTHILEVKGGGVALIDADNDGDEDLFFPNGATLGDPTHGPGARLYENLGGLRFRDITPSMGCSFSRWAYGVAVGDVDADGFDDIYIACLGPDALLRGRGAGRFEDATAQWLPPDDDWNTGAAFIDIEQDGDLDLYACGYLRADPARPLPPAQFKGVEVIAGPRGYDAAPDRLLVNDGGRFRDASESAGIRAAPNRFALNVITADMDGDRDVDIFVGNDSQSNTLWVNDGAGHFIDRGTVSGIGTNAEGSGQATMGIALGDVDGNGLPDVFTTNFSSDTNTLHLNAGRGFFDDRTSQHGVGAPSRTWCGWGAAFVDMDLDGDEDILGVNGHVYPQATMSLMDSDYRQPLMLLLRDAGSSRFRSVDAAGLGRHVDRSMVNSDLDGDGDVDAVIVELNGPVRVLENTSAAQSGTSKRSIQARIGAPGVASQSPAFGCIVDLERGDGTRLARRWIVGGGSFQSTASRTVHFGLATDWITSGQPLQLRVRQPQSTADDIIVPVTPGDRVVIPLPQLQRSGASSPASPSL